MNNSINHVILTGATGFIGRHLAPRLLDSGYQVTVVGRSDVRLREMPWSDRVEFVRHDLNDDPAHLIPRDRSGLVHLAWEGLPDYHSLHHFETNLPNSYRFIKHLVAHGVRQVLVTGTCLEYGMQSGALRPDTQPMPGTAYAVAKDSLRRFLTSLQREMPFDLKWARLFYSYGEGQNPRSIFAQLQLAIARGDTHFDMSRGEQLRDYLPIDDVADQLVSIFRDQPDGTYNVCSGTPISIRRLVEKLIEASGADIKLNLGKYPYPDYEPMAFWGGR